MSASTHVAIIGAGPYGRSIAAHLRERGVDFRIFGSPLRSWRAQMPKGMFFKSEGFASNLNDLARPLHARAPLDRLTNWQEEVATLNGVNIPLAAYLHENRRRGAGDRAEPSGGMA